MLRELSTLLVEMQESLVPFVVQEGVAGQGAAPEIRVRDAQLTLPLDWRVVLADGGPQLQADVPRSSADLHWRCEPSRLSLSLVALAPSPASAGEGWGEGGGVGRAAEDLAAPDAPHPNPLMREKECGGSTPPLMQAEPLP